MFMYLDFLAWVDNEYVYLHPVTWPSDSNKVNFNSHLFDRIYLGQVGYGDLKLNSTETLKFKWFQVADICLSQILRAGMEPQNNVLCFLF